MNKLLIVLSMIITIPSYMVAQNYVVGENVTDELAYTAPRCSIVESDTSVIVTYIFHGINLLPDPLIPNAVMPKIPGFGLTHTLGTPGVPVKWDAICLPPNRSFHVEMIDSTYIDVPAELSPSRGIYVCGDDELIQSDVPPIKPFKGFFPSVVIPSVKQHNYRGITYLNVCLCPVKYNSISKTARVYTMIKYKVTWENDRNTTPASLDKLYSGISFLKNIAINSTNSQSYRNQNILTTEDYLIISTDEYQPAVERFAEWKRMLGFRVEVHYQNGWSTDSIKTCIEGFNSACQNLSYVLLVGDLSDVTSFHYNRNGNMYVSDYQYGCIDNDSFPDLYLGRLLVSSLEEANILVDKIINYERNPLKSESFYNSCVNGAVFEADANGYERTRAVLTSELINKVLSDSLHKNLNFVYLRGGGAYPSHWNNSFYSYGNELPESILQNIAWNGTAKKMMNYLDEGVFYAFYIGHGDWDKWYSLNLNKDSLDQLNNGIKAPIVFSMSCQTGNFAYSDCFAQHFCSMEGNGCVAAIAATCDAPFGSTEILGMDMMDAIWPNSYFNPIYPDGINNNISTATTPTCRLGQILNQGVYKMRMTWDYDDLYTSRIFHCFGDPSMRLYTQQPTPFDNATVVRSNGSVVVNAGEEDAEISFYNRSTGEIIRSKGIQYTYNCGDDNVCVCLSGQNKIPYVDPLFLQNEMINGPIEYSGGTVKAGFSVTEQKEYGDVTFHSGNIEVNGNSVEFHGGTTVELGVELTIANQ